MAAKPLSENGRKVWDYMTSMEGENYTAADIADATGLGIKQVNGIITQAFWKKGLAERVVAEIEDPNTGLHTAVKFIRKTDAGREWDPDAPVVEKAEDAE